MAVDPKEYKRMTIPTYNQLLEMIDRGIMKKIGKKPKHKPFSFGFRGGLYLGAPGKDIFFVMPSLSEKQFVYIAHRLAKAFPRKPPGNHEHLAACIRYIYGCFEKQGCLRSKEDKTRMIDENPDWELHMKFMIEINSWFKQNRHTYGRVLHHEMLGHRYGDKAIIERNKSYLAKMINHYENAQRLALKCKSWKHTYTPFYWAAYYYYEMKEKEQCIKYHKLNLQFMEKHCPDARPGYRDKAKTSIVQLKKNMNKDEWKIMRKWIRKCKNKCLMRVKKIA